METDEKFIRLLRSIGIHREWGIDAKKEPETNRSVWPWYNVAIMKTVMVVGIQR